MENCTIYSHELDFEKVIQIVKANLPKAKIETSDGELNKSLKATIKGGFFGKTKTLTINYRQRLNPSYKLENIECGLTQNLAGMVNFIQSLPSQNPGLRNKFLIKVMSANCEMPFMADPEINSDFEKVLRKITLDLDAFIFTPPSKFFNHSEGQQFLDKHLNLILDTNGICSIQDIDVKVDAKYHDEPDENITEEQKKRKSNSEAFLEENDVKLNYHLPSIISSDDVNIRNQQAVINRAYALLIIAAKGEGVEQHLLEKSVEQKNINSFSPKELEIYRTESINDQQRAIATWRYESLYVLLWVLGKINELKYPSEICDVTAVVSSIFQPTREEFESTIKLRSTSEILDELDKTYRFHWACVDARIKGEPVSGNLNPSVVYERHYALNWLTSFQNQNWDDVQTPT